MYVSCLVTITQALLSFGLPCVSCPKIILLTKLSNILMPRRGALQAGLLVQRRGGRLAQTAQDPRYLAGSLPQMSL